jgi:hypothetical protein
MNKNATNPVKVCPEGKELNPVTKKTCLNLCKEGTIRNLLTAKCDKIPNENNPKRGRPPKNKKVVKESPIPPQSPPKLNKSDKSNKSNKSDKSNKSNKSDKSDKYNKSKDLSISLPGSRASSSHSNSNKEFELYYPDIEDPDFTSKISNNKEFLIHKIPDFPIINNVNDFDKVSNKFCEKFDKMLYQHFIAQYISYRTPYRSALLYHGVGVGKTCSSITIAESLLSSQVSSESDPMIWVIMPHSLKNSFKTEVFKIDGYDTLEKLSNQCTDQNYIKLLNIYKSTFDKGNKERQDKKGGVKEYRERLKIELKALLKTRYEIFTYDRFAKYIKDKYSNSKEIVKNKVIIIDEAHNIRSTNKKVKETYSALMNCLEKGVNNRLILLSATPMYNEPRDILELLKLLIINDKHTNILNENKKLFNNKTFNIDDANVIKLIKSLSGRYISYLKGKNPFTFALKLNPSNSGIKVLEKAPTKDMNNKAIKKENLEWLKNIDDEIVISKLGEAQKKIIQQLERRGMNADVDADADVDAGMDVDIDADVDIGEEDDDSNDKQNNNMKLLQPMNIVYDNNIGIKGFYNFFSKTKNSDPLELKYAEGYNNALQPDEEHLGKYSGKFLNICNFIRKSKGIVVIYSRFLLSGIIPIAICLEHLGYKREGTTNILNNAEIVKDKPVYEGINNPKYCILTSDNREYMGNTKIDELINIINSKDNQNGAKIKVILITPVASEGLSFFNTREIHLIEPWYHFNRADQIIGRGIRNCRHNQLNIENRNVSVFMHASVNDDAKRESIDINAFRISTRKYIESKKVDRIIMDNAIDCHLMKNINYFPKSIFKLDNINIETSQGALIKYNYGDKEINEPKCNVNGNGNGNNDGIKINSRGFRSEIYKHLLPSIKNSIRNIINIENKTGNIYIDFPMLKNNMGYKIDNDILMYAIKNIIYPNIFFKNKYITRYKDGILISPIDVHTKGKIIRYNNDMLLKRIDANAANAANAANIDINGNSPNAENKAINDKKAVQKILDEMKIDLNDVNKSTISIYLNITADNFKILIGYILKSYPANTGAANNFDASIHFISDCLYKQGILIKDKDIPSYTNNDNEYIGYINMFSENNEDDNTYIQYKDKNNKIIKNRNDKDEYFKMIDDRQVKMIRENIKLYNAIKQMEENARPAYITEYFSNRIFKKVYIPHDMSEEETVWGIIIRAKVKDKGETVDRYIFKVFKPVKGNLTGMECTSYKHEDYTLILNQLTTGVAGEDNKMKNKKVLCSHIANILLNKNKLVLYPLYKPKE